MEVPKIIKKGNRKYILDRTYPRYALYSNMEYGYKECFTYHELGMIEETLREFSNINPENVII